MNCTKHEQDEKNCIIILQDYNGSWDNLKKEKRYKETIQYFKKLKIKESKQ